MSTEIRPDEIEPGNWPDHYFYIHKSVEVLERLSQEITNWVWDNIVAKDAIPPQTPSEVSNILNNINKELKKIKETNDALKDYFCFLPSRKLVSGSLLTETEFHLLSAIGILKTDSYRNFVLWFYEDDTRKGYVNPNEPPPDPSPGEGERKGKVSATFRFGNGIEPEEVRVSFLRDDQRKYFEKKWPDLFARFKNE